MKQLMTEIESLQTSVTSRLISDLHTKLENLFLESLKRKGFEFTNKDEFIAFIKERCRCEENIDLKERVYFVDETPCFLHKYEIVFEPITEFNNGITMSANYGSFAYL